MVISDLSYLETVSQEVELVGGLLLPSSFSSTGSLNRIDIEELKKSLPENAKVAEAPGVFAASGFLEGDRKFAVAFARVTS